MLIPVFSHLRAKVAYPLDGTNGLCFIKELLIENVLLFAWQLN